jgi:hypothetical protein
MVNTSHPALMEVGGSGGDGNVMRTVMRGPKRSGLMYAKQ